MFALKPQVVLILWMGPQVISYTRKEDGVVLSVLDIGFLLLGDKLPHIQLCRTIFQYSIELSGDQESM